MKKHLFLSILLFSCYMSAQVGINENDPKATFDIHPTNADGSTIEGILIPRLSKSAIANMGSGVEESTTVFVNIIDVVASPIPATVAHVHEKGFYSFIDGTWKKLQVDDNQKPDFNKEYVCTANNIGQILKTADGYFECRNEAQYVTDTDGSTSTITDEPRWAYFGLMEGFAQYVDENGVTQLADFTLIYDAVYSYEPGYDNYYVLNNKYHYELTANGSPNAVGFSSRIPAIGFLEFIYWPESACGIETESYRNAGFEHFYITDMDRTGTLTCPADQVKLTLQSRNVRYRILN
ncbi:MAG: hypothetical protein ACR2MS_10585 [Weeksellaceae bacterium]